MTDMDKFMMNQANARFVEDPEDGIAYLEDVLSMNPLFALYKELKQEKRKQENEEKCRKNPDAPVTIQVKAFPDNPENHALLGTYLRDEALPPEERLHALKLFRNYSKDKEEIYRVSQEICRLTDSKMELFHLGFAAYSLGYHEEAFRCFSNSLPYSVVFLSKCYRQGLGTERNLNRACDVLVSELLKHNDAVILPLRDLLKLNYNYVASDEVKELLKNDSFELTEEEKKYLLSLYGRKGYLEEADIRSMKTDMTEYRFNLLKSYVTDHGCTVYPDLPVMQKDTIYILDYLMSLLESLSLDKDQFWFLGKYNPSHEVVQFYLDGYDSDPDGDGPYIHTPAEASIYFDQSRLESYLDFERLFSLLNDRRAVHEMKKLCYELKASMDLRDRENSGSLDHFFESLFDIEERYQTETEY